MTTPADDLARRAAETPSAAALSWEDGCLTYRQLDSRAATLADRFRAAGAVPGEAATLCVPPGPDAIAALFGLWRAGCLAVPLHERLAPAEVAYARRLVMSTLHIDNSTLHTMFTHLGPAQGSGGYAAFPDAVTLVLTSGSSGAPRAFGFTRAALAASASAVASRLQLTAADRWGLCLSMGHIGGLSLVVRAVMTGSSVRPWPRFDADRVIRAILSGDVTHLAIVPVMLRKLLSRLSKEQMPGTLRCVLVGGAAASRTLLNESWNAGLPVATTWGMTETASQVATAPPSLARRHPGTAGRPLRGVEVRRGLRGTMEVRGPTLASLVSSTPGAPPEPLPTDPDGWFSTQDLGRVEAAGLVRIEGRADAMIVSGGLNVSPAEVERVIEALPGVREAVVFGLPDEQWGEVVAAVVEGDPAALTATRVASHCRERLVRGRCPTRILVVDELPRTWTGKVMRSRLGARYGPRLRARSPT